MDLLLKLVFLIIQFCTVTSLETAVIQTASGKVQGEVMLADLPNKIQVQKFLNIPYAEAPVGNLRFAKPEPKKPWTGILKNSNIPNVCWHYPLYPLSMTEDCLVLDIWAPYPQKTNLSVMIWIHGGGFESGSGSIYSCDNVVAIGDVIVVTINYRLSVLGFFATGDDRVKGNFGLFDQRLAMKWVKENIVNFGGDPESITIFGQGTGAQSVSAHTLSSQSWPYFNRAILQSGSMNAAWAISSNEQVKKDKTEFLDSVGCTDNAEVLECLRNNITDQHWQKMFSTPPTFPYLTTSPLRVDGDFFTDDPKVLLKNGAFKQTPVLLGVTKDEGFYDIPINLVNETKNEFEDIEFFFEDHLDRKLKPNTPQAVYDVARKLYIAKHDPSTFAEAAQPSVDFLSDKQFICAAVNEATTRSNLPANVYLYRYSYASPELYLLKFLYPKGTFGFVPHSAELLPTFGASLNNTIFPTEERIISVRIIVYWTNFAKHGDPNVGITKLPIIFDQVDSLPNWPKYTKSSREYLDMESQSRMTIRNKLREKHCAFLEDPEEYVKQTSSGSTQSMAHMKFLLLVLLPLLLFT